MHADFVGRILNTVTEETPFGRAFITGKPIVSEDLNQEVRFFLPSYYAEHGVISTLVVAIASDNGKYGVLSVGSTIRRTFNVTDASFLTGFANVLGRAIDARKRGISLRNATNRLQDMIADRDRYIAAHERILAGKDRLLETSNVLTRELQHRVRNNLQLVYSMLSHQLSLTTDETGIEGLSTIAHRVMILVEIYEHLLGADLGGTIDFGAYISSLCSSFSALHSAACPNVKLTCQAMPVDLGLDMVTTLGLVISELVTNSYAHAFPDGMGTISVSMSVDRSGDNATISFIDDGVGFVNARENKRHGMGLVKRLMEQVGGSAALRSDHGSEWTLKFPVPIGPSDGASTRAARASVN